MFTLNGYELRTLYNLHFCVKYMNYYADTLLSIYQKTTIKIAY
jgi:hypothetical protein